MFGGADLVDDLRRTVINSSQDGTATITHAGLTDGNEKLIFFIGTDIAAEDSSSTGINSAFGVCHISGNDAGGYTFVQRCIGWASDHNDTVGKPASIISTDRVLDMITEAGGQDWGLEVTAFSSSGGTITVTTRDVGAGAGMEVYSFIVDLDDRKAKVGSVDGPTSGATWDPTVSLTFIPQIVSLLLTDLTNEDTIATDAEAGVMGISSNSGAGEETCHSWYNEDAIGTTNTNNLFRSRAIDLRDDDVTTVLQDHSHSVFDSTGWTYTINTENETVAKKWGFWTIEEAVAPSNDQTLTATATGVPAIQLSVAKTLAVSAVANAGLSRKCFIPLSETAVGIATIATLRTAFVTAAATAIGVANLARKAKIGLGSTATGIAVLGRKIFKTLNIPVTGIAAITVNQITAVTQLALAATATAIIALRLKTKKTLASTASGIATLGIISTFRIVVATVATGVAILVKKARLTLSDTAAGIATLANKAKLGLSASATGVAELQRRMKFNLGATATGVVSVVVNALEGATLLTLAVTATAIAALRMTVSKTLQASSSGVAVLVDIPTFRVLLANVGTGIVTLTKLPTFRRALSVVATAVVGLAKKPKLSLGVTAVGTAALNRTILKTLRSVAEGVVAILVNTANFIVLAAVAVGIPTLAVKVRRGLNATGAGVANIGKFVSKTLRATATGVVNLIEVGPGGVPEAVEALKTRIIGFFGGPGQGPGR